jgi:hypothetical protein
MRLFTFLYCIAFMSTVQSQTFKDNTRYLYATNDGGYYEGKLSIIEQRKDTTILSVNGSQFSYYNKKIYGQDSALFFDFGAEQGDTLTLGNSKWPTKVCIDSVRNQRLEDNLIYTHFYAHDIIGKQQYIVIQGIGELYNGLDKFYLIGIPENPYLKAVCRNDSLLFWNGQGKTTCNFDSLTARLSVGLDEGIQVKIYPNPTRNILYLKGLDGVNIRVLNVLGTQIYKGIYKSSLDVSTLPEGVYLIDFMKDKKMYRTKFIKE